MLALCSISSLVFVRYKHVCSSYTRCASLLVVEKLVKRGFFGYLIFFYKPHGRCRCLSAVKSVYIDYTLLHISKVYIYIHVSYILLLLCYCVWCPYTAQCALCLAACSKPPHHHVNWKTCLNSTRNSTAKTEQLIVS